MLCPFGSGRLAGMAMRGPDRSNEFTDLLTAQQSSLFAYIYAIVHNLRDAEDVYQDVAITLWQKFDGFKAGTNFAAWARATARFKVRDFLRSKRRGRIYFNDRLLIELTETLAASGATNDAEVAQVYHRALLDCMSRLNAIDQQLVALSYSRDCTLKEVAEQEGRSLQSVCNSLKRIRSVLFDCITQEVDKD
jgi:RNA polymerase sigma-70 factor, ECF subfamily